MESIFTQNVQQKYSPIFTIFNSHGIGYFFHRNFVSKWQLQTDYCLFATVSASEKHKATITTIKKTLALKLKWIFSMKTECNSLQQSAALFSLRKIKNYRDGHQHCLLTKWLLTTNVAVKWTHIIPF